MQDPRPHPVDPSEPCAERPVWEVFVRVIDNRGDAGVGWRLTRHLARRGQRVRLWIDDDQALQGMADEGDLDLLRKGSVEVRAWPPERESFWLAPGVVAVVEAFGCTLPEGVQAALGEAVRAPDRTAPAWINLEYLSAESYVERSHGLPSPRGSGPAAGCVTWFFYPGFTDRTGGLLLEADPPGGPTRRESAQEAIARRAGPLRVSRFDYRPPGAPGWLAQWAEALARRSSEAGLQCLEPGTLAAADDRLAGHPATGALQRIALPWLTQSAYDSLLQSCDLNIVRGEDSFVRAQWAGRPMIWQAYPQHDGAHAAKLEAWLDAYLEGCDAALGRLVRQAHRLWNGFGEGLAHDPDAASAVLQAMDRGAIQHWTDHAGRWRQSIGRRPDLATSLIDFVARRRASGQAALS